VLRRRTTTCQKTPENYAEAVANFIVSVEQMRKKKAYDNNIIAMDETAVWFDCPDTRCIETKGAKEVGRDRSWGVDRISADGAFRSQSSLPATRSRGSPSAWLPALMDESSRPTCW
jgi:hypothetical protein